MASLPATIINMNGLVPPPKSLWLYKPLSIGFLRGRHEWELIFGKAVFAVKEAREFSPVMVKNKN